VRIELIQVPYHLGHEGVGMGAGPRHLVATGLPEALREAGHEVEVAQVHRREAETNEVGASFEVVRRVAETVARVVDDGSFPLALAGNCLTSLGVVAGLGREVGVVWLDAHADFNTPDTSPSGFQDGMGLAILTGTSWLTLRETIQGFRVVPEKSVVLVGVRDVDELERARLDGSSVTVVRPQELDELPAALEDLAERVEEIYLHLDLDVLDPAEGRANEYAAAGGLSLQEVERVVGHVADRVGICGASITAFDPTLDEDGRVIRAATGLAGRIAHAAQEPMARSRS
jgi:arginase